MRALGKPLASVAGTSCVLFATYCCAARAISCACTAVAVCALSCIFCTVPTVTFLAVSAAACTATLVPAVAALALTVAAAFTVSAVAVLAACCAACAPARAACDTASEVLLYAVLDAALYDACTVFPARDVDRHGELFANGCTPRSTGLFLLFRTARLISLVTASLTVPDIDFARPKT